MGGEGGGKETTGILTRKKMKISHCLTPAASCHKDVKKL